MFIVFCSYDVTIYEITYTYIILLMHKDNQKQLGLIDIFIKFIQYINLFIKVVHE